MIHANHPAREIPGGVRKTFEIRLRDDRIEDVLMNDGKKIKYNLLVGVLGQAVALVLGILLPKLVITNYGSEVNGLLSSVTNIYAYIALVEAGVAAASCQALYKAVAENDQNRMNAILSATDLYYQRTGYIYLGLIFAFSSIYPLLIKTEIPFFTVVLVILFNGLGNVINYFFHGKYLILLKADGKNYVRTGLELVTNTAKQIIKIILIKLGYNVIYVQFAAMMVSCVQMIYITYYIKKNYAWLNLDVIPDRSSISQSKNVFVHEINYLITSNVDTVVLTVFQTLKTVSVYSLYNLLFSTLNSLLRVVRDSLEFKIAHLFHEDREKFQNAFSVFEVYYITLVFAVFSVAYYFVLPFISLYTKNVSDVEYIVPVLPILFVLINLLSAGKYPSDAMVHIAGHFKQTQSSAVIETVINLVASIFLVQIAGIAGVLLGTIISSVYRTVYLVHYVNNNIIHRKTWNTYLCWCLNFVLFLITLVINRHISINLDNYFALFLFCVPYTICTVVLYFTVVSLVMKRHFFILWSMGKSWYQKKK